MRDIRGDLQDRAGFLEEQISAAQAQFEKRMELFTREHESKIADLQAELEAVSMLMEREYRRIMSAPDVADERRQSQQAPEQAPVASAPEAYEESGYLDEEPEYGREDDRYREPAVAESAPAARAEDDHRPMSVERQDVERRPAEAAPYRPAARAPEPRPEAPRHEPQRHEAPRHEAPREELPRDEAPRQEQPRREEPPRRYEPVQRDRGPVQTQRQPLADFLIRKLGEVGNMSLDDLCSVAMQEGYFAEGDNPDRTVHMTLMNVVKAGFIRQMPNGTFAPASVMDTIRLRRAI